LRLFWHRFCRKLTRVPHGNGPSDPRYKAATLASALPRLGGSRQGGDRQVGHAPAFIYRPFTEHPTPAHARGRVGGRRPVVDDDKRRVILTRRAEGQSIREIAVAVKVSVGVVHKTLNPAAAPVGS